MKRKKDRYEEVITYITENQKQFYRLAYSYIKNQEDALDIVQNAVCRALENREALKDIGALQMWFYRILVNESISYVRKYGKEIRCEEMDVLLEEKQAYTYMTGNGTGDCSDYDGAYVLYQEIGKLPIELQNIIRLHYFAGFTLNEVADVLDLNLNTVKAKLYRGLKKMKLHMEESKIWEN